MSYIMKMPYRSAMHLIAKAIEQNQKEYLFKLYTAIYPNMDKNTFMSFETFCEKSAPKKVELDCRDKDVILQEIQEIQKRFERSK